MSSSETPRRRSQRLALKAETPTRKVILDKASHDNVTSTANDSVHFDFGGPVGATACVILLPILIIILYLLSSKEFVLRNPFKFQFSLFLKNIPPYSRWITYDAFKIYFSWLGIHILMERLLPCELVDGTQLPDGKRLKYRMNGHLQFWLTLLAMAHVIPEFGPTTPGSSQYVIKRFAPLLPVKTLYDNYLPLMVVSILGSFVLSLYVYVSSFLGKKQLAKGGNTGYAIYDFWMGRELNPRFGSFDLKEFVELKPGLLGWMALNLGMAWQQYTNNHFISGSMASLIFFQGLYVWDALYCEKSILTTMDITTDGFGFMLAFGCLTWVPFIYTLQSRFLVDHDPGLSLPYLLFIVILHFFGFWIFRAANNEKDAFRRNPNSEEVKHLSFMKTKSDSKLLISGWWGLARKINYTGDFIVTLSYCLLCGFESPVPYFHAIYFAILLIHRALRDDVACQAKYGSDWDEYKKKVPYLFIPYII